MLFIFDVWSLDFIAIINEEAADWFTKKLWFNPCQGQDIVPFFTGQTNAGSLVASNSLGMGDSFSGVDCQGYVPDHIQPSSAMGQK
jgi:hypothetical protein